MLSIALDSQSLNLKRNIMGIILLKRPSEVTSIILFNLFIILIHKTKYVLKARGYSIVESLSNLYIEYLNYYLK